MKFKFTLFLASVGCLTYAQETDSLKAKQKDSQNLQEVTVTGSRNKKRTVVDSSVPIDVINVQGSTLIVVGINLVLH